LLVDVVGTRRCDQAVTEIFEALGYGFKGLGAESLSLLQLAVAIDALEVLKDVGRFLARLSVTVHLNSLGSNLGPLAASSSGATSGSASSPSSPSALTFFSTTILGSKTSHLSSTKLVSYSLY